MLEPTLLSRCWVVGGWTALKDFGISSPTSTRQKNIERLNSVSLRINHTSEGFVSTVFLHSFSFCHPNLLTAHKVKHINEFTCTPPPPRPSQPDRTLTVQKLSLQISPPTHVHSHPNILSNLSSYVVGSIWQIVLKWTIQKRNLPCQQQGLCFTVAWFWQVTSAGSLMGNGDNDGLALIEQLSHQ